MITLVQSLPGHGPALSEEGLSPMALKDFDAKQFLLQKGEQVGLGVAVFLMVVLIICNLFLPGNGFFSGRPSAKVADLATPTKTVASALQSATPTDNDKPTAVGDDVFA